MSSNTLKKQGSIPSVNCSLFKTSKIIVQTKEGKFCAFCFQICKKGEIQATNTFQDSPDKCTCTHEENPDFFQNSIQDFFELMRDYSVKEIVAYNLLLSHKKNGKSVLEIAYPQETNYFAKDYQACKNGVFKWDDLEINTIEKRADFMKIFTTVLDSPKNKVIFTNTIPLEEIFPLKFIDMITDNPDYTFGQPIYNNTWNFYSYLFDFFCKFYLEKDFQLINKTDAQDIETYSPLARIKVRQKNQTNQFIRDKYFNDDFNLHKFAIKLVEKFVPGATWRWIGGNHKAHIYCIKICKILMEYGLVNELEAEEIKNALYVKIQIYKSLEKVIDKDSKTIDISWINIWTDGMIEVREYYSEILIHYLYMKQDNEIANIMKKIYKECGEGQNLTKIRLDRIISFNKSILFEPEFSRKMMDFVLGYVLSQNLINTRVLSSQKIEAIADNFLHIFSNVDDPYLHSLRLITEADYLSFVKQELNVMKIDDDLTKEMNIYTINVKKMVSGYNRGKYFNNEQTIFKEISDLFDKLNEKLDYMQEIQNKSIKSPLKQKALFNSNIPTILLNFVSALTVCHTEELKIVNKEVVFWSKFGNFTQFYLNDNIDHHSILFMYDNFLMFENIFYLFPAEISELLYELLLRNSLILLVKEYVRDILADMFFKYYTKVLEAPTAEKYITLSRFIDILAFYISFKLSRISEWLPEYDLRNAIDIIRDDYKEMFLIENYETLLTNYKNDKSTLNDSKLTCYMNFLSLISVSTAFRYTESCYLYMDSKFPMDKLNKLIAKCGNNIEFRSIFMEIYSNFHVDFKNHLLDNRQKYYFSKPADMQYEEDPFYDKEYEKTIDLIIREMNFITELYKDKEKLNIDEKTFIDYINSTVFGTLIKLMNYFLVIKEGDLKKLAKYIPKLEELKTFLLVSSEGILSIYGIDVESINSPERKKYEAELASIDPEQKIRIEKKQIIGNCKIILETCSHVVQHKPLMENKRKLIPQKSTVDRTKQTKNKISTFSNKLAVRRENINLPFLKAQRKREKTGGKIEAIEFITAHYEHNKMVKTSVELEKNSYLFLLKDDENSEMVQYSYNLCAFIHNSLKKPWDIDKKNSKYTMVESLIHCLFISTETMQNNLLKVIQESGSDEMLNKVWIEMRTTMSFVKFKTNIDKYWKETFRRCMILIKFHQYLCEDDNKNFKAMMRTKILPNDTIDRVQRWTTIFQRMSDNCQWHYNYSKGEINDFDRSHRAYLFPLVTGVFDNLAELCTGPCIENQKKVYTYIYDRYNGFIRRYWRDPNTEYYKAKLSLIEFIACMAEGNDPDVLTYQITNLELNNLFTIIIDSLRQLFYCIARKDPFTKKKMIDYPLYMKDFNEIQQAFQKNEFFSKHTLLEICLKLFAYIRTVGEVKSKYEIFCNEREDMILNYEKTGKISNPTIKEDDLVTYKFISRILAKIEIVRDVHDSSDDADKKLSVIGEKKKDSDLKQMLIHYYFPISSKCYYLSQISKIQFLKDVNRSSLDSKLSGLYSEKDYFQREMVLNQERYGKRINIYKYFGSGNYLTSEIITLILAFVNNIMLVSHDYTVISVIGSMEIGISIFAVLMFSYFSYPVIKNLNRMRYDEVNVEGATIYSRLKTDILDSFLLQKFVWVFLYHIICVFLGFYYANAFLTLDLLSTINFFDTMQFILKSVTEHIGQLFSTLALAVLLMFCYTNLVVLYFYENFESDQCQSFISCYFNIMETAFTNGQGTAGLDNPSNNESLEEFYGLFFLNISFFIVINTILLNIVLAILVDTFSALRQKSEFFEKDNSTVCFICGIQKFNFEKSGIDFETHVKVEHNLWNYVNFLVFMNEKSEKDCNGVEAEIFTKIKNGVLDWFPRQRSILLGILLYNEKFQKFEDEYTIEDVLKKIKKLDRKFEKIDTNLNAKLVNFDGKLEKLLKMKEEVKVEPPQPII